MELSDFPPPRRMRASDAERETAIKRLADHYADGRLDVAEYVKRMEHASDAVYVDQLPSLFLDLPNPPVSAAPGTLTGHFPAMPKPVVGPRRSLRKPLAVSLAIALVLLVILPPVLLGLLAAVLVASAVAIGVFVVPFLVVALVLRAIVATGGRRQMVINRW